MNILTPSRVAVVVLVYVVHSRLCLEEMSQVGDNAREVCVKGVKGDNFRLVKKFFVQRVRFKITFLRKVLVKNFPRGGNCHLLCH